MVSKTDADIALREIRNHAQAIMGASQMSVDRADIGMADFVETLYRDMRPSLKQVRQYIKQERKSRGVLG